MATFEVPAQTVSLAPVPGQDGRWLGQIRIGGDVMRIEAYATDTSCEVVQSLIEDLENLAQCGSELRSIIVDDRPAYMAAMPRGK